MKPVLSETRAACCMLWVTMTMVYCRAAGDQLLDLGRGDRVERRAGLVHQQHLGIGGDAAGDAQALLLAARHAQRAFVQPVLGLVPQRGGAQRALAGLVEDRSSS
jgi:hypothetical protein